MADAVRLAHRGVLSDHLSIGGLPDDDHRRAGQEIRVDHGEDQDSAAGDV